MACLLNRVVPLIQRQNRSLSRILLYTRQLSSHGPCRKKFEAVATTRSTIQDNKQVASSKGSAATIVPAQQCHSSSNNSGNESSSNKNISRLFMPVPVQESNHEANVGEELTGPLDKVAMLQVLVRFYSDKQMKEVAFEHGLDDYTFQEAFISFRKHCIHSKSLSTDLHILLSDIIQGAGHTHNIFPSFLKYAKQVFPHLQCMDDLCMISDLSNPPNWYPEARSMNRRLIFHAGPTNSGKTYHALQRFLQAESGVYCSPLKMLANEVYAKSNEKGTPCDLVTGEERRYARQDSVTSSHVASTVEMANISHNYEVAIIDEIQMLREPMRGWAWTRALLGLKAKEIHLCGEEAALPLIQQLALSIGEEVEIHRYKRLTPLTIEMDALENFSNVQSGDCIVCFSKRDIHYVTRNIEKLGHQVAVIYGGLPPGTKLAQAQKFNDPNHPCKIMVATDAIGMGLNLSIRRIIFNSLIKPEVNEKGEKEMNTISVSQALQIGGRAGRYGTQWEHGYVTTMKSEALPTLRRLMASKPNIVEKAGLHPTAEQIELFAYHIPNYTLSNLIDIFVNVCTVDKSSYFMCGMDDFKFLGDLIQHINLPLRSRYVFCCAPINNRMTFVCAMFLKMVRQFSESEPATLTWLCHQLKWPMQPPQTIEQLLHLEQVFDVMDLYLWLSYRFPDMFPEGESVQAIQGELDQLIEVSVGKITSLVRNSTYQVATQALETEYGYPINHRTTKKRNANVNFSAEVLESEEIFPLNDVVNKTSNDEQEFSREVSEAGHVLPITRKSRDEVYGKKGMKRRHNRSIMVDYDEDNTVPMNTMEPILQQQKKLDNYNKNSTSGRPKKRKRVLEHLLERGLITPKMLAQLKKELAEDD